ncbi:MAG: hypothetical protein WD716_11720 [Fimbriimonadaceae bacterium]
MLEYSRVGRWHDDEWLFWLVRAMFEPIGPKGGFRVPHIGAMSPSPPEDLREWPTYPVALIDDVPVLLYKGASLAGVPEPFYRYARDESKNWKIKTRKLTPPNDPFPVFLKVLQSSYWPFKGTKVDDAAFHVESYEDSAIPLIEILNLVRTAYRPVGQRDSYERFPNGLSYQQLHSEFLLSGARWDDQRQLYVRRDGTFTLDEVVEYVQHTYKFEGVPGLDIELQCERNNEDTVGYRAYVSEIGKQRISNAVIVAIEVGTDKELHWMTLNESPDDMMRQRIKTAFLAEEPHLPILQGGHATGSGFRLAAGKSVRFVVLQRDMEYVGPTIRP